MNTALTPLAAPAATAATAPTAVPKAAQPSTPVHTLAPGTLRRLGGCAGRQITVLQGRLWLTEPGDADDHFVAAGHTRVLFSDGPVVIENDSPCEVRYQLK